MTRRKGRVPALLAITLSACAALTACSTPEPEPERGGLPPDYVSFFWVERQVMLHTLDRMLVENDPEEVLENSTGSRDRLFEARILQETEDGYTVELDYDEWRTEEVGPISRIDAALANATEFNEVTWCGETVNGEDFVDAYVEEFWETLDSHEEYTASIADYVDCGDGTP
ncbi:hypothetical protein HGB44_23630 [Nocardiopsis dassonvillei subsp. albirubida]|uniref:Lipoprotein n=2 Tax=Nocardiopsis alborubida TaxID=146802 RepID=A0A7X6RSV9_9ACTN|nr:hypothetical protein [Nocardiopsis alborubida]